MSCSLCSYLSYLGIFIHLEIDFFDKLLRLSHGSVFLARRLVELLYQVVSLCYDRVGRGAVRGGGLFELGYTCSLEPGWIWKRWRVIRRLNSRNMQMLGPVDLLLSLTRQAL